MMDVHNDYVYIYFVKIAPILRLSQRNVPIIVLLDLTTWQSGQAALLAATLARPHYVHEH